MSHTEIEIQGMTCADCAAHVRRALETAGAREITIDWRAGRGKITAGGPSQAELNESLSGTRYRVADERVTQLLELGRALLADNAEHVAACRRVDGAGC